MIRYIENDNDVFFPKINARPHKSVWKKYSGMTIPDARRMMKRYWIPKSAQNEYIHYLKNKSIIISR